VVRSFTVDERRARLARRHLLADPPELGPVEVASRFVGLHATDPATPYLTLWARVPGFSVADLDAALYESRTAVKHLAMRRTLWVFDSADLPVVQAAASDRVAANERKKLTADVVKSGIAPNGDAWLDTAAAAVLRHLSACGHASAKELRVALPELAGEHDPAPGKSWGGAGPISPRVITVLGVRGDVVRGPNEGAWTTSRPRWVAMSDWLGAGLTPADHDEARAAVLTRWLRTFGPATVGDVKWWFGNTLTWARDGLRDVNAVEVDVAGSPGYALPDDLEPEPDVGNWCALLPGLDVTTMGWQDRDWYLGEHRNQVFDRNGNAGPTVWVNGRVVGGWRQAPDGRVVLEMLEDIGTRVTKTLTRKADQLTEWLDGTRINPRFPSPLSKVGGP
jgi:winged helix DNA-binding protein